LGDWEIGRLTDLEISRLADWEIGRLQIDFVGSIFGVDAEGIWYLTAPEVVCEGAVF
jgi:hypothetical protein